MSSARILARHSGIIKYGDVNKHQVFKKWVNWSNQKNVPQTEHKEAVNDLWVFKDMNQMLFSSVTRSNINEQPKEDELESVLCHHQPVPESARFALSAHHAPTIGLVVRCFSFLVILSSQFPLENKPKWWKTV